MVASLKRVLAGTMVIVMIAGLYGCKGGADGSTPIKTTQVFMLPELHNGDAKLLRDRVVTSVDGTMKAYNRKGELLFSYDSVPCNWLSCLQEDEQDVIVYANGDNETGIAVCDKEGKLISQKVIMHTKNLQIDPTIVRVDNRYYITVTEIDGTINNPDPEGVNGKYTIHMYVSEDLEKWDWISDVASEYKNLEDVDVVFRDNGFFCIYEKEEYDKGNSAICLRQSKNAEGTLWGAEKVLLDADCDHEPATIECKDSEFILWYSSDKAHLGDSYMGGNVYQAVFDLNFELKNKDVMVSTQINKGILLYDVEEREGKVWLLMAKDYMTTCDMVLEAGKR